MESRASGGGVSYYNYDHLGNTRVVYHSVINCVSDSVHYVLEYAADYYPFGAILREWENCEKSRFLFTYKERDAETGWDNLGARLYDSDIGRFFGVDALAWNYAEWSSYVYVFNNPISLIDPTGLEPEGWSEDNIGLANRFGVFGNGTERYSELFQPDKESAVSIEELMLGLRSANVTSLQGLKDYFQYSTFQRPIYPHKSQGQGQPWLYIYTQGVGWIDIVHFANGALSGLNLGDATEIFQSMVGNPSAWSYEDLQSNLQGVLFRMHHGNMEGRSFLDNLEGWFRGLHATDPEMAPNWVHVPPLKRVAGAYGDNGESGNMSMPIPQNRTYIPLYAPLYNTLPSIYKVESYYKEQLKRIENSPMKFKF